MTATRQPARIESVTGVILAGGKSTRMGEDKAFLRIGGQTLIERTIATLASCFTSNLIIANRPAVFTSLGLPVFPDDKPDLGPLEGIATALRHARTDVVFVVACDMPFLDADLIRFMAGAIGDHDAVAVKVDTRFEPLHATYHCRLLPTIEARMDVGDASVNRLLGSVRTRSLTGEELAHFPNWRRSLQSVNTPEELEHFRRSLI